MNAKSLKYVQVSKVRQIDLRVKNLQYMSVPDCAFRNWEKGLSACKFFGSADYLDVRDLVSAHAGFMNSVCIVPRFFDEVDYWTN